MSERVPYISKNWFFDGPFRKKCPVLVILVPVMIRPSGSGRFFEEIGLFRPEKLQRPPRSMRLQRFLRPGKSILRSSVIQVLEFNNLRTLNISLLWCFGIFFWQNHENSCWILAPFLSEAVEASLCYLFKNCLMKLKCPNLRNTQIPPYDLIVVFRWPPRSSK